MKAYTVSSYGAPKDVLSVVDHPVPKPKEKEVLIKVRTAAVNDYDWCICSGRPYEYRLFFGPLRPRRSLRTPGMEVAGIVEQVGTGVSKFKVGDAVFGDTSEYGFGSFAEYMAVHENALNMKPDKMSFEEAVTIPHAGMLAVQGYQLVGGVKDGMDILINGGGGGVGAFALQVAKQHNVNVVGVDTGEKLNRMLDQGFDAVIDYKQVDFTEAKAKYDIIFDCRTSRSPSQHKKAIKDNGHYVSIGGQSGKLLNMMLFRRLHQLGCNKKFHMVALKANQGMGTILKLYQQGQLKFQIDGPFSFEQVPEAIQRFGDGKHHGKIVVRID
ncbi:MAG: hypothetical protein RL266_1532 [Bacteroidota bacterium]